MFVINTTNGFLLFIKSYLFFYICFKKNRIIELATICETDRVYNMFTPVFILLYVVPDIVQYVFFVCSNDDD